MHAGTTQRADQRTSGQSVWRQSLSPKRHMECCDSLTCLLVRFTNTGQIEEPTHELVV